MSQWHPPANGNQGQWIPPESPAGSASEYNYQGAYGDPSYQGAAPAYGSPQYGSPQYGSSPEYEAAGDPSAFQGQAGGPSSSDRLESLQEEVASLKIRGGNTRVERQVRVGGAALMAIGVVLIVIAWFKASAGNTSVNNQMAYLMSGGLLGIASIGIGAAVYLRSWMARQRYWQARQVVESREYTTQVLLLLARIEKLLGGTGELPADQIKEIGSHWEKLAVPPNGAIGKPATLIGDPNAPETRAGMSAELSDPLVTQIRQDRTRDKELVEVAYRREPAQGSSAQAEVKPANSGPNTSPGPHQAMSTGGVGAPGGSPPNTSSAGGAGSIASAAPARPTYKNEHGHVWDHDAQQWYDPVTSQWYDGVGGKWYRRNAEPPAPA